MFKSATHSFGRWGKVRFIPLCIFPLCSDTFFWWSGGGWVECAAKPPTSFFIQSGRMVVGEGKRRKREMQAGSSIPSLSHVKSVEKQNFPERRRKRKKRKSSLLEPSVRQNCNTVAWPSTTVHKGIYFCLSCVSILKGGEEKKKSGAFGTRPRDAGGETKKYPPSITDGFGVDKASPPLPPSPQASKPTSLLFLPSGLESLRLSHTPSLRSC